LAVPSAELTWSTHTQAVTSGPKGFEDPVSWSYPELDLAWDSQHPGAESHRIAAEEIVLQFQGVNVP
jgi:phospholipase/lecithinase/hemolysin